MKKRTAREFSRKKIWEIATQYASTDYAYSRDYFSREYDITYKTFYTILERAVIESVVDEKTVMDMASKSAYNAATKGGKSAKERSLRHYRYLMLKRNKYMLPKWEAIQLITRYSNSEFAKKTFAALNFIEPKLFDRTLYEAILENWVSDEVVEKLKKKSLTNNSGEKTLVFWEELLRLRNENKKNQG